MPFPGDGPLFDRLFRSAFDETELDDQMMSHNNRGYHVHKDEHEIQVDVDLPGVAAKDVTVKVWNNNNTQQPYGGGCVVQWSGQRAMRRGQQSGGGEDNHNDSIAAAPPAALPFANRIRLGSSVDCDQLAANLSRGVLRLTAPLREEQNETPGPRSIPISVD